MTFVYLGLAIAGGLFLDRMLGYGVSLGLEYYIYRRQAPQREKAKAEMEKFYAAIASRDSIEDDDLPGGNSPLSVN